MREKIVFLIVFRILLLQSLFSLSPVIFAEPPIEVIYLKASDVEMPSQDELDSLRDVMLEVQSFFASEMDRHGFGQKTFDFNKIKIIEGAKKLHQYTSSHWTLVNESPLLIKHGLDNQIYVVFLGKASSIGRGNALSQQLCADIPEQLIYCNNLVVIPTKSRHITLPLLAHEIGHAFSLDHAPKRLIKNRVDIMSGPLAVLPGVTMKLKDFVFSYNDAAFLNDGGRLSVQQGPQDSDQEMVIDTDVNNDGYTDLSDCLIVRSAMSIGSIYDTDINNDGITNILDLMLVKAAAFEAIAAAAPSMPRVITTTWGAIKQK